MTEAEEMLQDASNTLKMEAVLISEFHSERAGEVMKEYGVQNMDL